LLVFCPSRTRIII